MEFTYSKANVVPHKLQYEIDINETIPGAPEVFWDEPESLRLVFGYDLTPAQITELDSVVTAHTGVLDTRSAITIFDQIFFSADASGDSPTQQERIVGAIRNDAVFILAVQSAVSSQQWAFARSLVTSNTDLMVEDKTLILGILPEA